HAGADPDIAIARPQGRSRPSIAWPKGRLRPSSRAMGARKRAYGSSGRRSLRCARLQISRLSAAEPASGLNEPEPGWLASTEDTDEVDAHHACSRHLRRRVHRTGGAGASGTHVTHAARLRDAAGARRREPALLRHLRVWRSQAAVRLQLLSDQA